MSSNMLAWPPRWRLAPDGVELFDPFHLPRFNTLLLLTSGTTVTWPTTLCWKAIARVSSGVWF